MEINSFQELLEQQIAALYGAETQLLGALSEIAAAVSSDNLREALASHLTETKEQVKRLERIAELLEIDLKRPESKGMRGLIEEAREMSAVDGDEVVIDAGIIAAAQRIEHYEIAAYGTARAFAERLGYTEVADLLADTLDEEENADLMLNEIAENEVNEEAAAQDEQDVLDDLSGDGSDEGERPEESEKEEPRR